MMDRDPIQSIRPSLDGSQQPFAVHGPTDTRATSAGAPARILVVEDDYFVAIELEHRLREAGFEIVGTAVTADEAVEMAAAHKPDLAIMDIRLNGARDGIDAALILFQDLGIRSIFATAHGDAETRRRAAAADPLGWLEKPYSPAALVDLVKSALWHEK